MNRETQDVLTRAEDSVRKAMALLELYGEKLQISREAETDDLSGYCGCGLMLLHNEVLNNLRTDFWGLIEALATQRRSTHH